MKRLLYLITLMAAGTVGAEPCVGSGFDIPLTGATNTNTVNVDVPSARAPSRWQEGQFEGHFYRLYSNFTAELSSEQNEPTWKIFTDCQDKSKPCILKTTGTPPAEATAIIEGMGACILGKEIKEELPPVAEIPALVETPEIPALPCGLALIDDDEPVIILQRLVTLAGVDVGAIDGIYGPNTENAVLGEFPDLEKPIDIELAITLLDAKICNTSN